MAKIRVSGEYVSLERVDGKDVLVCVKSFSLFGYDIHEGDTVVLDVRESAEVILRDKAWLAAGTVLEGGHFLVTDSILDDVYVYGDGKSYLSVLDCFISKSRIVPSGNTCFVDSSVIGCSFTVKDWSCRVSRCVFKVCNINALRDCEGLSMRNAVSDSFGGYGL